MDWKRRPGRPLKRWEDDIAKVADKTWSTLARDRCKWKNMEEAFTAAGGPYSYKPLSSSPSCKPMDYTGVLLQMPWCCAAWILRLPTTRSMSSVNLVLGLPTLRLPVRHSSTLEP
ncbi:jg11444 [Pararge aegeria aegeria]|uniref:Jg11444 protein n=1 Tax=Pararge aegeria aegeria TaxID=348720 RepID=A0A8S4RZA1_9NEOP|nr:jg11444 [Pararge aegeria aegeria]